MRLFSLILTGFISILPALPGSAIAQTALEQLKRLDDASVLLVSPSGKTVTQHLAEAPRIPASTLKILMAWASLEYWGRQHHFETDFFLNNGDILTVKGYGDPFLVSEELDVIVSKVAAKLDSTPTAIALDDSFFDKIEIDGQSRTQNPYDAPAAALAGNFNTVLLEQSSEGIRSGEPQTPLTQAAMEVSSGLSKSRERISLHDRERGLRHFAEIFRFKLQQEPSADGADIPVKMGTPSEDAVRIYRHRNTRALTEVVSAMLQFSTNFIANQLYLMLGAEMLGAPATMEKSHQALNKMVEHRFHWTGFAIKEGAGLSRENRLSAEQLVELLSAFEPYHDLLPEIQPGVFAKTGTLKGVRTLAGYIEQPAGRYRFAILINNPRHGRLREAVLQNLVSLSRNDANPHH